MKSGFKTTPSEIQSKVVNLTIKLVGDIYRCMFPNKVELFDQDQQHKTEIVLAKTVTINFKQTQD